MVDLKDISIITQPVKERLNQRQITDFRHHRVMCLEWLLTMGKNPKKAEGYAFLSVKYMAHRMDVFYRWVWDEEDRYTTDVTTEHADAWMQELARNQEYGNTHKRKSQDAVKMLFKWRHHELGGDLWEPEIQFSSSDDSSHPRDYLTMEERGKIREAAMKYGAVPAYGDLTPEARDRWKAYLAQRFEKPKSSVSPDDWERANDWKIPSLVFTSLDAGLRPIEVERATTRWVDVENGVLRIPRTESSKNQENWIVGLSDRTATSLGRWLDQLRNYEQYDDTDALWLSQRGNPYNSATLRYLLHRLCEIADIPTEDRKMSWYAIRHSTGTYMTREEDLAAAQAQLRHTSVETTMKYDQAPVEDRKDALNRMG